jgi:hypothetical protein
MRQSWGEFLRGAGAQTHGVQVYAEADELAESVATYLAAGFDLDSFYDRDEGIARFDESFSDLLDRIQGRRNRPARVFGEMVDLLCRRGDANAADELERRWNDLARQRRFSLLCGYRLDVFEQETQLGILPDICRSHSHVLPARNYARFARAVDEALREVLGPNKAATVYVLVSRMSAESHVPLAQQILMWVSENLPKHSIQILASARAHYVRPAA